MRRALLASFGTTILIQLLGVVTGVILARELGPTDRGALAAVLLWPYLLIEIGNLGMFAATHEVAKRRERAGEIAATATLIAIGLAAVLGAIGYLGLPLVLDGYGEDTIETGRIFMACVPIGLIALTLLGVLNGLHRYKAFQALRAMVYVITVVALVLVLAEDDLTVRTAVYCYLAAQAITLVAVLFVARGIPGRLRPTRQAAHDVVHFGIRAQTSRIGAILNERLGQIMISLILGATDLGLFVVAWTLTSLANLVGNSTAWVALPTLSAAESAEERRETGRFLVSLSILISVAVTVPLIALAPQIIDVFFGPEFEEAASVARVLLLASILSSTNRAVEAVLQAVGRPLDAGVAEGIALVAGAAGMAIALPTLGIVGAGWASLAGYTLSAGFMLRRASAVLGLPARSLLVPDRESLVILRRQTRRLEGGETED